MVIINFFILSKKKNQNVFFQIRNKHVYTSSHLSLSRSVLCPGNRENPIPALTSVHFSLSL